MSTQRRRFESQWADRHIRALRQMWPDHAIAEIEARLAIPAHRIKAKAEEIGLPAKPRQLAQRRKSCAE